MVFKNTITFIFLLYSSISISQNKYWVFFKDKNNTTFDPYSYFDPKAIERRVLNQIDLYDQSDFPLNETYIKEVRELADSLGYSSRWLNAQVAYCNEAQLEKIKVLSFVKDTEPIYKKTGSIASISTYDTTLTIKEKELLVQQLSLMQGEAFYQNGFDGKGVRIAILDAGFPSLLTNPAFEHIRKENRIIKTYDFIKKTENVDGDDTHGTMVLSCVAGKINDNRIGLATGAEVLLARTEYGKKEPFAEEEFWLAAAEWADKNGAQIINSSLGYTSDRYFPSDMNGKRSLVAKAAAMAARKGILVVNAAGNEGAGSWKKIITPADVDSVLAVGGINPETNFHTSFSSYGPTADKRLKPNVCAMGHVIAAGKSGLTKTQGTSFASPLIAGFAACALQTNKSLTNMELFKELEKSGNLHPYFDYAHGFGVPQATYFTNKNKVENTSNDFKLEEDNGVLKIVVTNTELLSTKTLLYYHIENSAGVLEKYCVIEVEKENPINLIISDYKKGSNLRFHMNKQTNSYLVK